MARPVLDRAPMVLRRHALLSALLMGALVAGTTDCASHEDPAPADEQVQDLDLGNVELDLELVADFPATPRAAANRTGARDEEITSWNLRYMRTADGFEGIVAFGREGSAADGPVRYLMALDAHNRQMLLLDGVSAERAAKAQGAISSSTQADFVADTFDDVTVTWLRSELTRAATHLQERLDAQLGASGLAPRAMTATQICALRLAVYAASFVIPFTKIPLVGKGASLTGQFVGSFLVDAAGSALLGQVTDAARSSAAAAASGLALASVLRKGGTLVRGLGASGAGWAASFVVGAVLGADGDYQLLPGEHVEKDEAKSVTIIVHADGSRTVIPNGAFRSLLPASCRQALAGG